MSIEPAPAPGGDLPRLLGPTEAICTIVGSVIGSGIFIVPASVALGIGSIGGIALAWVLGGVFSLAGALTMAELAAMLPRAGGPYVYIREAYGPLPAFLFGWTEFLIIRAGSMATLAAAFALYFAQLIPAPAGLPDGLWRATAAVAAISTLAAINVLGTGLGGRVQVVGTSLKLGALTVMIALPFALGKAHAANLAPHWPTTLDGAFFKGFMGAMIGVLWAYDGWVNTVALAEEIRDPGRNIPRALVGGMLLVIAAYLGMTLVYHLALPMAQVAGAEQAKGSPRVVAAVFCRALLGGPGVVAIALVVMGSTFIALNGNAMSGPRTYFAMARDGLFPRALRRVHRRFETPANAVIAQAAWAILLTIAGALLTLLPTPSGGMPGPFPRALTALHDTPLYDLLYTYVIFGGMAFYTLVGASVFTLRIRRPDLPRPYRTWGYPVTPTLYILASLLLMGSILRDSLVPSLAGLFIILSGLPAYAFFRRGPRESANFQADR